MRRIFTILAIVLLGGCAGMSKEECLYADWRAIGYEDGAAGAPVSAVSSRRQTCAKKIGAAPDMAEYLAGREEGLRQYCNPSNGYRIGAAGSHYYGVCTGPEGDDFAAAYEAGRHLYTLQAAVDKASEAIYQAQNDLKAVKHDIAHAEQALVSLDTPHKERIEYLAELKELSEERGRIETAIIALLRDHARAEEELAEYQAFIAESGPYPRMGATAPSPASYAN